MGHLRPYLLSEDTRSQAEFYVQSLGGEISSILTHEQAMGAQNEYKDKVIHCCVTIAGGQSIFMSDAIEPYSHGTGISLSIAYKTESEANEAFARLATGGTVRTPIEMQPFGVYYGDLTDKFGVNWMITSDPVA